LIQYGYYTLLVDNYEEFAEQKNDDGDDDEMTALMRKNAKEKKISSVACY
jgi:hypothetical protein